MADAVARSLWGESARPAPAVGADPRWVRVEMVREARVGAYRTWSLSEPCDAALLLEPLLRREAREVFLAAYLDTKHRINAVQRVGLGAIDHVPVEPREVFTAALLTNAAAVIVAHNHPSGDPEPSHADCAVTRRLVLAGNLLGVAVLDHLVIGDGCWTSLRSARPDLFEPEAPRPV